MVLIIGILAAVALAQYTKAIERSRAMEAATIVRAIAEAQRRYILEHGESASTLDDLDIAVNTSASATFSYTLVSAPPVNHVIAIPKNSMKYSIIYFLDWPNNEYSNKLTCRVDKAHPEISKSICKSIGKNYKTYNPTSDISIID